MRVCPYCHLVLADSESVCPHDGTQTAPAETPPVPGALQSKFKELKPFAQGQTGTLQLAVQNPGGYRGLLKVIPLSGFESSERVRLKRELRKQTRLAHDGLPRIVDGGEIGQELWLFRDYVAGESLAQRIRRMGRLEPSEALVIAAQVASALDELQRNGLLHRDVKPGHVILQSSPGGLPISKLIDAGVAARLPSGSVFDLIGTPAYISPEQVGGKLVSFRSDLYALGCMLFEMLTGRPPFVGAEIKAVLEQHRNAPVPELAPELGLPSQAVTLLRALLAKEPRQRPFSAQQVRRTLEPLLPPGAPLPALQTRAPSSAGGISVPPPAEDRQSKPSVRPVVPKAPRVPSAARADGRHNKPAAENFNDTQEIELDDIDLAQADPGPKTMRLSADEIEEIDPEAGVANPKTIHLGADDLDVLAIREEAAAELAAAASPSASETGRLVAAVASEPEVDDEPRRAEESAQEPIVAAEHPAAPEPTAAAQAEAQPAAQSRGRRVDFDVESLFDDDVPPEPKAPAPGALHDAAPTQIYRKDEDLGAPARTAALGHPQAYVEPDPDRPAAPDPEGTVVIARPPTKRRPPWLWIGAGAAVLLLLVVLFSGGDEAEDAAASAGAEDAPGASAEGPSPGTNDTPKPAAPPSGTVAREPAAAAQPAQPAGDPPQVAPEQAAAPAPAPEAQAQALPSEPPVVEQAAIEQPALPPNQPAAAPSATRAAKTAAKAEPPAALSAAAASAKLGPSAGNKTGAQAARVDRVAKAEEFKQQARAHYQAGRHRDAALAYRKAIEQNPADPRALVGLGTVLLASGDADGAIAAYSRAVRLEPTSANYHASLGRAYLVRGDRDRARAAYRKALEINPEHGAAKTALQQLR